MSATGSNSTVNQTPARRSRWPLAAGCAALLFVVCLCGIPLSMVLMDNMPASGPSAFSADQNDEQPVLAVAVNLDDSHSRVQVFIGDAQKDRWNLPPGNYHMEILGAGNTVYTIGQKLVAGKNTSLDLSVLTAAAGGAERADRGRELLLIANLVVGISNGELTYLSATSNDFKSSLFTSQKDLTPADLKNIHEAYSGVMRNEEETIKALQALEARAAGLVEQRRPSVLARQKSGVLSSLIEFFSAARDIDKRAVEDILKASAAMSESEKADAFQYLPPGITGNSRSFDEMIQKLKNGELNQQASQIRSSLGDEETFYNALQESRGTNRPLLQIAHDEGGLLVSKGAEAEVEIIKKVLSSAFPGIEKGFEYAEKADKWANLIRTTYHNPAAGAAEYTDDYVTKKIKDQIKESLVDLGIGEDAADETADYLTGQIKDQLSELPETEGDLAGSAAAPAENVDEPEAVEPVITVTEIKNAQPTAVTIQTKKAPQPTAQKTSPAVQKTSPSNAAQCDALDYVTVISGKLVYDDEGGCVYEATGYNDHVSNKVFIILHTTSGNTYRYTVDPKWNLGIPFSMKSPEHTFSVDWYMAVFYTADCLEYLRGVKMADYPSLGIRTVKVNFPACGK